MAQLGTSELEFIGLTPVGVDTTAGQDGVTGDSDLEFWYPFACIGGVSVRYENKVWDTQANGGSGGFVTWTTLIQDFNGQEYPGPGAFGVDTSDYVVLTINYNRLQ